VQQRLVFGEGGSPMQEQPSAENSALLTVVLGLFLAVCGVSIFLQTNAAGPSTPVVSHSTVQIVGSETMRPLIAACAEAFMATRPQADIIVRGGGTGDGMAAILHGIGDVAMASRQVDSNEKEFARSKGIELAASVIALDAIALIVHRDNPVRSLTLPQIKAIFSGEVKDWSTLGGPSMGINLAHRAVGSGTAGLFEEKISLRNRPPSGKVFATNEEVVAEVASDVRAIGYTGLGALRLAKDKVISIGIVAEGDEAAIRPDEASIRSGTYPLTRQLSLVASRPMPTMMIEFIEFCSGTYGRTLVERSGYLGVERTP
jgi:phosphate transport system substrate-binding protein